MKQLLLAIIPLLMLATISNVYASRPRLDYDERYEDVPGAPECWVDGYDAGFAQKYDTGLMNAQIFQVINTMHLGVMVV
ncbi:MAG: hypothetical protein ACRD8W_00965 [Nitrososphaeraceae archaeon]